MNAEMYEDRIPRVGFKIPEIGDKFTLVTKICLGSTPKYRAEFNPGTTGFVVEIREPLKKNGGYVGCVVKFIDESFERIYPGGMVVPWDEISDTERFAFI